MAEPPFTPPDPRDVDPAAVRRAFSRAAATYDAAAVLQREVASRMIARLDVVKLAPAVVLDALLGNIQDAFNEHGVQIMSPNYEADPPQPAIVPRDQWYAAPAMPPRHVAGIRERT